MHVTSAPLVVLAASSHAERLRSVSLHHSAQGRDVHAAGLSPRVHVRRRAQPAAWSTHGGRRHVLPARRAAHGEVPSDAYAERRHELIGRRIASRVPAPGSLHAERLCCSPSSRACCTCTCAARCTLRLGAATAAASRRRANLLTPRSELHAAAAACSTGRNTPCSPGGHCAAAALDPRLTLLLVWWACRLADGTCRTLGAGPCGPR
jgi:hypothetical protein